MSKKAKDIERLSGKRYMGSVINKVTETEVHETQEDKTKRTIRVQWLPFFKESLNIYINDLALRAYRSTTHGAVINAKQNYTAGKGFIYEDTRAEQLINGRDESLWHIFRRLSKDYIMSGNAYLRGIREDGRVFFFHQDCTSVRIALNMEGVWITNFWREIKNAANISEAQHRPTFIPFYDGTDRQKEFILHLKNYVPEYSVYGMPDHGGALRYSDIEYMIASFNNGRFKRGLMPSGHLQLVGEPPEGMTPNEYVDEVNEKLTGEDNDHKMLIEFIDDKEMASIWKEFENLREGEFLELEKLSSQAIIKAHNWYASLSGLTVPGSLGDRKALITEYELAMNTVIIPNYQRPLLRFLGDALEKIGIGGGIEVMQVQPVSVSQNIDPTQVMTIGQQQALLGLTPDPKIENMYLWERNMQADG